ncbi:putative Nudix hydrolase NudL [Pseudoalteromonas holothuriae]|uniref:Nudix hydrolase NudL n=1 Tax=Pseudoalteromonas holothuriae TaxID=2963714 RepID=A0A9W4QSQ0_9GAMM|nr:MULTISPECIES: CoA pyrophosphatase [unclassified Pseudoalteromonas]CAH9051276.1 putative Nudix hydrolase NudL [Pseudoalteromonas sp. CIP111854]CAH9056768.1 putative Nudix hydrolase NudL [Pseudoalteromonas sp. CIP111951]
MTLNEVITRFNTSAVQQNKPHMVARQSVKSSAVLIPLVEQDGQATLLFCKRAAYLTHHPSQLCFPGGKAEPQDKNLVMTALRETQEELGILPSNITPLGTLNIHATLTGFNILPVVAKLAPNAHWHTDSEEVEHAFTLPLTQLVDTKNWHIYELILGGKARQLPGFITPHGLLWGATASLVQNFIALIK